MFIKYPHLEKFGNEEVSNIEFGITHIFPKLDGTNASVWFEADPDCDGGLKFGSRNRVLSLDKDNHAFMASSKEDSRLQEFFNTFLTQYVLYGEWLVPHTIKHYRADAWYKFYIFDVYDKNTESFLEYDIYQPILEKYGLTYIPCIKKFKNGSWENFLHEAKQCNYLCQDGLYGEGIVIKNYSWKNKYNRQPWAKIVTQEFKESHVAIMGAPLLENISNAQKICDLACTKSLIEKEYAKLVNDLGGWSSHYIPRLLHTVFYSVVKEELWDCLKKISYGTVNFKELQQLCILKVKKELSHLF